MSGPGGLGAAADAAGAPPRLVEDPDALDPALAEAVRRIVAALDPEAVWLFGSRARGDARPDSDWDLFVVLDDDAEPGSVTRSGLRRLVRQPGASFDVVPCRRFVFEAGRDDPNGLGGEVWREGRPVHVRAR